jgi:SAM-dependent methyltransferase
MPVEVCDMPAENVKERLMAELYDQPSSEFYDYQFDDNHTRPDVAFYIDFAVKSGGQVLELGCGTGRILLPTARAGVKVTGLDKSAEMLKICRSKLEKESPEVKNRVSLVNADMRDFHLGKRFSLVSITFGPFNNLITVDEQMSCLNCIRQHLRPHGALVFDVYYITLAELVAPEGSDLFSAKKPFETPDGRLVTWGVCRYGKLDFHRQVMQDGLYFNVRYPDGHAERLVYTHPLVRYYYRYEVEHLLARTGFKTAAVYGDFDKSPFGARYPSEAIFLARKA